MTNEPERHAAHSHAESSVLHDDPVTRAIRRMEIALSAHAPLSDNDRATIREKYRELAATEDPRIRRMFDLDGQS